MKIETALPTHFERLVAIWESSVRATHHFLQESDIAALRPLLLNAYLPNLKVVIARDDAGVIHGFLGVDENRIEMLFVDDTSRGKGVGKLLLQHAIEGLFPALAHSSLVQPQLQSAIAECERQPRHRRAVFQRIGQ